MEKLFNDFTDEQKEIVRDYLSGKKNVAYKSFLRATENSPYEDYCKILHTALERIINKI